jgi:hypothetical protein
MRPSGLQNQQFDYIMRSIIFHKISYKYISYILSNHGGSTEATRGSGIVSHVFVGLISIMSSIFCKFPAGVSRLVVGALHPLTPLWPARGSTESVTHGNNYRFGIRHLKCSCVSSRSTGSKVECTVLGLIPAASRNS